MSLENEFSENMEMRVLLLGLYKKKEEESFKDVVLMLEDSALFTRKEGKKLFKKLKELSYITDEGLTLLGIQKAKEVEMEFKI